jgi:CHAT domain-containing protein/tetratricopeptide (TPR) repeat protein
VLTLLGPGGKRLLDVDSLSVETPQPVEELHWVAGAPGELRIALTLPSDFQGACDLRLVERRRATDTDRRRALAEAELARGHALRRTKEPERCRAGVAFYESAQRRFAELGLPRRRGEALYGLGLLQRFCLEENDAALQTFTRAEPLFAGEPASEATMRQFAGEMRFARGDLDGAIGDFRRALDLRRQIGNRRGQALTLRTLGDALHLRGRYDEAAAAYDQALALWQAGDDAGARADLLLKLGHLDRDLGETDRARERFQEALGLFRQAKDRDGEAKALNAQGLLALDQERPAAALEPFESALKLRTPGTRGWAITQLSLGVAWRDLGRNDDAGRAYAAALPILREIGDSREEARCLANLGRLEASTGRDAAALDHLDRALGLFRTLADPPQIALALEGKAQVLRRRGRFEEARGLMEEALVAVERHRFSQASTNTRAEFFSTQQNLYDDLIDLLMEMHRKEPTAGYAAAALEVSERSLARSLLDGLAQAGIGIPGGGVPELHAREHEIEREIDALVSRQTSLASDSDIAALLRPVEEALGRRWEDLDRVRAGLRASDPRYAALTQPEPWSAAGIRRDLLDRDTLLLEYRLGETRSFLWAVTPDSLKSFELPGRAEIERVAGPACDLIARSWSTRADLSAEPQLARLSRMLLAPAASLLPGKRLLVVGDGILQSLPFAALPEPGGGEPLVAGHEIVSLPSVSALGALREEAAGRPAAPKTLWILADPDFGGRFPQLSYTRQEAEAILDLAPGPKIAVQGSGASREAVLRGALRDYRFLHFATHGSFAAGEPGGGRLVLAQVEPRGRPEANGFLYLADIYELDLRADLVVLSACQSARGREVRGEGMMGMTRGFFYAGAERVLVSLWNVNDRVTVELMRRFYRGMLAEGLSPAAALRAAQDAIRRQTRFRAPYYWAGFVLQGEWRGERRR